MDVMWKCDSVVCLGMGVWVWVDMWVGDHELCTVVIDCQ